MLEMHTRQRDRSVKLAVGALVLASVFALLLLIWVSSTHINPLSETYSLKVALDHGQGIQEGAPVTLVGIPVGRVERIILGNQGKVLMSLQVLKSYQSNIREDSVIFLIQPMVGVSKLDISLGTDKTPQLEEGGHLSFKKQAVFEEILETIPPKMLVLDSILENLSNITQQLAESEGPFQTSLSSMSTTTQNFEELSSGAVEVMAQVEGIIQEVDKISHQGVAIINRFESSTQQLPDLVKQLEIILLELTTFSTSMKNISQEVEKTRSDLPELVSKGRSAASEADDILRALKTTPMLNSAFEKPPTDLVIEAPRDDLP